MKYFCMLVIGLMINSSCCTKELRIAVLKTTYSNVNLPTILNVYSIDNDYHQKKIVNMS